MSTAGCPFCGDPDYLGYEVLGVYDGVLYWVCSECGYAWPRFTDKRNRLTQASQDYAHEHNEKIKRSNHEKRTSDQDREGTPDRDRDHEPERAP